MTDQNNSIGRSENVYTNLKNFGKNLKNRSAIFLPFEFMYMTNNVVKNTDLLLVSMLNIYSFILSFCIGGIIFISIIRFYENSIETYIEDDTYLIFGTTLCITISLLMINRIALYRRRFKLKT